MEETQFDLIGTIQDIVSDVATLLFIRGGPRAEPQAPKTSMNEDLIGDEIDTLEGLVEVLVDVCEWCGGREEPSIRDTHASLWSLRNVLDEACTWASLAERTGNFELAYESVMHWGYGRGFEALHGELCRLNGRIEADVVRIGSSMSFQSVDGSTWSSYLIVREYLNRHATPGHPIFTPRTTGSESGMPSISRRAHKVWKYLSDSSEPRIYDDIKHDLQMSRGTISNALAELKALKLVEKCEGGGHVVLEPYPSRTKIEPK